MPNTKPNLIAIAKAAQAAHEANRAYCMGIGDTSQAPWVAAAQWQRDSAITGVLLILDNPDITPKQSHESWLKIKFDDGWGYGPTKDPEQKLHPCCVPYGELPAVQRYKDIIFGAVVRGVLEANKLTMDNT